MASGQAVAEPNIATAREMLSRLNAREISARELLDAHVARHEQLAKTINAVIASDLERAYRDAEALDNARAQGKPLGALGGLPMTIKDGFGVEQMPAAAGSRGLIGRNTDCD